jgi:hypothetical protein
VHLSLGRIGSVGSPIETLSVVTVILACQANGDVTKQAEAMQVLQSVTGWTARYEEPEPADMAVVSSDSHNAARSVGGEYEAQLGEKYGDIRD